MNVIIQSWHFRLTILVGIVAVAGCSESKHSPKSYTIVIEQMKFKPAVLTVEPGDSVTWVNKDLVTHNIVEQPDSSWRSPVLASGARWTMEAQKSSNYYCSIHVVMKGKIEVK
jgi:plastocyanin